MPDLDFRAPRLFVDAALREGERIALERNQSNYLGNVLRLSAGDTILVFNGRDGEWQAAIEGRKRPDGLTIVARTRPQDRLPDIAYVFARSSTQGSTTWCKRRSRWGHQGCSRC